MENWLAAEREVLFCPPSELNESSSQIRIETVVPGIDARTLQVDVLPNSITIEGTIGEKRLLRRYDLSDRIDPDEVEAKLHDGVLQIIARKLASEEKIAQRAAA
jgi:HSP20 family molecular chaperone IbpA